MNLTKCQRDVYKDLNLMKHMKIKAFCFITISLSPQTSWNLNKCLKPGTILFNTKKMQKSQAKIKWSLQLLLIVIKHRITAKYLFLNKMKHLFQENLSLMKVSGTQFMTQLYGLNLTKTSMPKR